MVEMQVGDQTIRYDRRATARIYASITTGWAEKCRCVGCRNYLAQRDAVYVPAFSELLNRLDIDSKKDAEVVADGPLQNGLHHYGGWFFFVGEMLTAGENVSELSNSPYFAFWFTRVGPCPKEFRSEPHLAIEFAAHFKWILSESWDSDSGPALPRPERPGQR
jgi:hypothetical protein